MNTGINFWSLSFWLWSLAALASAFMLLRGYFLLSYLWHLPEKMPKIKGSMLLKHGDLEALNLPPRKSTAIQVAKMMVLAAGLLLAYDAGIRIDKGKDYAAWKARHAQWERIYGKLVTETEKH